MSLIVYSKDSSMNNRIIKSYIHYKILEIKNSRLPKGRKSFGNGVVIQGFLTEGQQRGYSPKLSAAFSGGRSLEPSLKFDKSNKCVNAFEVLTDSLMLNASY